MQICLIEPFFTGSHQRWATGLQAASRHNIRLLTLPGRHWKWRMHGAAISLAEQYLANTMETDLVVATDMLDLSLFCSLTKKQTAHIPFVLYFHENQLTYPWSPTDADVAMKRDNHYAFINYSSALVADRLCFNSDYHRRSFLEALPAFLQQFPDHQEMGQIEKIRAKSEVLPLGLQLKGFDAAKTKPSADVPVILWNHRWEYDKNPDVFFNCLFRLKAEGLSFKLIVLGEGYRKSPPIFELAKAKLTSEILHWGYADSQLDYASLLGQANILPVTNRQDFFGAGVVEAIHCGCYPLLPFRLAYPEHIPEELHSGHFYKDDDELYVRLKMVIEKKFYLQAPNQLQNFVARYDWSNLATAYDQLFDSIKSI